MKNKIKSISDKPVYFMTIHIVVTVILFFIIMFFTTTNVSGLQRFITERAYSYAREVSTQIASDIKTEFETRKMSMAMVADSIQNVVQTSNSTKLQEFLNRKSEYSIFDNFIFIGTDEIHEKINDYENTNEYKIILPHLNLFDENNTEHNHTCIQHDRNNNIYYTHQISRNNKTIGLLIGFRNKKRIQKLIKPKIFDGNADSCIINTSKELIVSPNKISNLSLSNYIIGNKNSLKQLETFMQNVSECKPCIIEVETKNKKSLILCFNPLDINDWGLITFLPTDNIRGNSDLYLRRTTFITIGSIFIFLILTILSFVSYRNNKKLIQKVAFRDPITGGMNETAFRVLYHQIVKRAKPNSFSIILMNIKNFKLINEQFGTDEGDKTLRYVYNTIKENLTKNEFLARTEADTFYLCLKETNQKIINERLNGIVSFINSFNGDNTDKVFNIVFHKGAYTVTDPSKKLKIVQGYTKSAFMVALEQNTEECVFYDISLTEKMYKEQEIINLFDKSIKNHDFKVFLQPKVRLEDGSVGGAEALVRWYHPERGIIYPNDFIPIFEKNGMICKLDEYMFTEVCKILADWQKKGRKLFPVSVNLSRQHFKTNLDFLDKFYEIVKEYNIPRNILEFELTESIFFETSKFKTVKESIQKMHELGFLCSLDDFGSGFSSLGLLKEFDIDTIKFDRQFFIDLSTKKAKDIIDTMIDLSLKLGIHTVAEGIETGEQVTYLDSAKCDMIQGYFYSKPLCLDDFEKWIQEKQQGNK